MDGTSQSMVGRRLAAVLGVVGIVTGALMVVGGAPPAGAAPATYTVDSLLDAGDANTGDGICATAGAVCTLRAAIQEANAHAAETTTIAFSVAGTTKPAIEYPDIAAPVTIDGRTAPGYAAGARPTFAISCDDAPTRENTLTVSAQHTVVRGIAIDGCRKALSYSATADHTRVYGLWINQDGIARAWPGNGLRGIVSDADDVVIGGPDAGQPNRINANDHPILLEDPTVGGPTNTVLVQSNVIGTNPDGSSGTDFQAGISIGPDVRGLIGGSDAAHGNTISGGLYAIRLADDRAGVTIQGNRLGAASAATISTDGNNGGIEVTQVTPANGSTLPVIGGTATGQGNVISGNHYSAIRLAGPAVVRGNLIGTDATGTVAVPNGDAWGSNNGYGIQMVVDDASQTVDGAVIGGTAPGAGNVISGNKASAIRIDGSGYQVQGNLIGVDVTGTKALANGATNITFAPDAGPGEIGGVGAGQGNTIANSAGMGVFLGGAGPVTGIAVRGNRIYGNKGLNIDLYQHSATFSGNGDQIHPTVTSTSTAAGSTTVNGTVSSDKPGPLLVDVYASNTCQTWGTGEAKEFLGTISVPYAGGNVTTPFSGSVAAPTVGSVITATTTQATNGTSQLSPCGPHSDLQMSARANRTEATLGDDVAVELKVTNAGPDPVSAVTLPITTASGEGSAVPTPAVIPSQGSISAGKWNVGSLASGASATVCVRGRVTRTSYLWWNGSGYVVVFAGFSNSLGEPSSSAHDPYRGNGTTTGRVDIDGTAHTPITDPNLCPTPDLTIDDGSLTRPASGTSPMTFVVRLTEAQPVPATVHYETGPASAAAVEDFVATKGTITIPAGQTSASGTVPIVGGQTDEPTKTFYVRLSEPTNVDITDDEATGSILANHLLGGCPAGSSLNRRFVCHLYADALGRTPDPSGLSYWVGRLDKGLARSSLARRFLNEPEAYRKVADRPYVRYIGRHGTTTELQGWADKFEAGTATPQDARISVLASNTYFWQADSDDQTFVEHLYRDVFRRAPDAGGVTYWVNQLEAGASRATVAKRFIAEPEGRRKVIGDLYLRFLRRDATTTEANTWVTQQAQGKTEIDVGIGIVSTSEYFNR